MILSMTGYGKSTAQIKNKQVQIEIKTLNSKNIDINFRMPQELRGLELNWRKEIASVLKRGKIDVFITLEKQSNTPPLLLNKDIISAYIDEMKNISAFDERDNAKLLEIALSLPETTKALAEETEESDIESYFKCLEDTLLQVVKFRTKEGVDLEKDIHHNLTSIQESLLNVVKADVLRKDKIKDRLENALSDLNVDYDKNRFEQELIYYLEKFDISEEKTRLKSHIEHFNDVSKSKESNGKKLNFIAQEMGREINTIGSKANDALIQSYVVEMKDDLEKIKEQLLNIL